MVKTTVLKRPRYDLFLTIKSIQHALLQGRDLSNAYFCLNQMREDVFSLIESGLNEQIVAFDYFNEEEQRLMLEICRLLRIAESEGRCFWKWFPGQNLLNVINQIFFVLEESDYNLKYLEVYNDQDLPIETVGEIMRQVDYFDVYI
ncbi:hypothetical protein A2533_03095 [Candidatus Falkowbacteria bacterium RIFOXYD2_FULL_35_9]|uniref:Uncharacterized protein n=1 Tax=Candidatus Falkowbacteria bacterium RIFOXYC2_FULL_36_12 TaxID=1798002 RepID=A0A1F5SW05_9BACT|nr:MAG: hypothetical protein A2478_00360 [Candidatus Falkowbacteria bacterium RIFOXYC2_FULL_36_12]OGF31559.1 MAG: hypothetical protein A2300_03710 [Candidatus Falkowbacteria bacterium RIFOXYB2_FULL_35_7]OGF33592.1 MAG: hypothetical protein A2223_03495 [Candidatus Falkowbacteria bacterium RIFOXYA2_FULL_35_8]OGF46959.1 MAG: hypothetical protein A2533_03095 [Candidatus Falkowbacteria bacterium RIFOXYD2_FULL_35_9]